MSIKRQAYLLALAASCLLLLTRMSYAQAAPGSDNPAGVTGDYNGQITTGGSYDPYTGNAKRVVDDLVVAGAVGKYPLKWSRNLNSRGGTAQLGNGGTWRHSYEWGLWMRTGGNIGGPDPYEGPDGGLQYPDGRYVTFSSVYGDSWGWQPHDDLYDYGNGSYMLQMLDGGQVIFGPDPTHAVGSLHATQIIDPNGLVTTFSYDGYGRLSRITEPAGRFLQLTWVRNTWSAGKGQTWVDLITKVQAFADPSAAATEEVNYSYTMVSWGNGQLRHYYLTGVNYADGGAATYAYYPALPGQAGLSRLPALIQSCDDVRYEGPMKRIAYEFLNPSLDGYVASGQLSKEKNLTTGQTVSQIEYPPRPPSGQLPERWRRETRGDGLTRTFEYYPQNDPNHYPYDLNTYTDWKNQPSSIDYASSDPADGFGYRTIFTDARGKHFWTDRNWSGGVIRVTYPDSPGQPYARYTYDANKPWLLMSRQDENGHSTSFQRYPDGRVSQVNYPDGSSEQFTYNGFGQLLTHTMSSGGVENIRYDFRGLKTSSWPPATPSDPNPQDHPTQYFYYTSGPQTDRLQRVQDPRGYSTSYEYNLRGQVTKVTHQDGTYTQSAYHLDGTLAWSADENHPGAATDVNQRTRYFYDEYKRVEYLTNPLNQTTTYFYGPNWSDPYVHTTSNLKAVYSPMGKTVHTNYDENWRINLKLEADTPNAVTLYWHDAAGNLTSVQDPRGNVTTYGYDERNRKISATDPAPFNNQVTQWQYDPCGNKTKEIRPDGSFKSWSYDGMNRVQFASDWRTNSGDVIPLPNQRTTYVRGDAAHNVTAIIDQKGATYGYSYDLLNRKTGATYPLDANGVARSEAWDYDIAGNLAHYTDPAQQVKTLIPYDNRNRVTDSSWSSGSGPSTHTVYDAASRTTSVVTNGGETTVNFGYDDANRQIWEEQTLSGYPTRRVEAPRDADGNRSSLGVVGWYAISFDYTQRNQLWHIYGGSPWFTYTYDSNGNMTKRQDNMWGINDSTNVAYDQLNRPRMWENTGSGDYAFARSWYEYDNLSREAQTWRDEQAGRGEQFHYDVTNQLQSAVYNALGVSNGGTPSGWSLKQDYTYTPDKLNRASVTQNGTVTGFSSPSGLNQYGNVSGLAMSYDGNFNLTGYPAAGGWTSQFNAQNQLTSASGSGNSGQFVYDGLGRCVKRTLNTPTRSLIRIFAYDGWKPIVEWDENGSLAAWNIYGAGADEILWRYQASYGHIRYHTDKQGSITFLLDGNGNGIERYSYDAFGAPTVSDWNLANPRSWSNFSNRFMFTGREFLAEMAVMDYRHRFYHPALGRFLQSDPIGFDAGDMNLFRYCADDPVDGTDPTGLITDWQREKAFFGDSTTPYADAMERMWQQEARAAGNTSGYQIGLTNKVAALRAQASLSGPGLLPLSPELLSEMYESHQGNVAAATDRANWTPLGNGKFQPEEFATGIYRKGDGFVTDGARKGFHNGDRPKSDAFSRDWTGGGKRVASTHVHIQGTGIHRIEDRDQAIRYRYISGTGSASAPTRLHIFVPYQKGSGGQFFHTDDGAHLGLGE